MTRTVFIYDCTSRFAHLCVLDLSRYTGKERDQESGLDYFGARYYASNMGRFMSPDWIAKQEPVPYSKLDDPQTFNLYGYVRNNPLSKTDPDGHCDWCWNLVTRVSIWVAQHPAVSEAFNNIGKGTGGTIRAGVGAKTPAIKGLSNTGGEATATAYVKGTAKDGFGVGVDVKGSGTVAGAGVEVTRNYPVIQDGSLVNPITNATTSTAGTIGGDVHGVNTSASGNPEEISAGVMVGEGVVAGGEVSDSGVGGFLHSVGNAIVDDIKQTADQISQGIDKIKHPN